MVLGKMKYSRFLLVLLSFNVFSAPLEQSIQLINQGQFEAAIQALSSDEYQKNNKALYWLGIAQYKGGEQFDADSSFLKAAELGNPWAMEILTPEGNSPCDFMGWPCDSKWKSKALDKWQALADQGDGKAIYALTVKGFHWWKYVPVYNRSRYQEIAQAAVKIGGYKFSLNDEYWEDKNAWRDGLISASENGFAPAMLQLFYLYDFNNDKEREQSRYWMDKAVENGYINAIKLFLSRWDTYI